MDNQVYNFFLAFTITDSVRRIFAAASYIFVFLVVEFFSGVVGGYYIYLFVVYNLHYNKKNRVNST